LTFSEIGVTIVKLLMVVILLMGLYVAVTNVFVSKTSETLTNVKNSTSKYFGDSKCDFFIRGNYTISPYSTGSNVIIKPLKEKYNINLYVRAYGSDTNVYIVIYDDNSRNTYKVYAKQISDTVYEGRLRFNVRVNNCGYYRGEYIVRFVNAKNLREIIVYYNLELINHL